MRIAKFFGSFDFVAARLKTTDPLKNLFGAFHALLVAIAYEDGDIAVELECVTRPAILDGAFEQLYAVEIVEDRLNQTLRKLRQPAFRLTAFPLATFPSRG